MKSVSLVALLLVLSAPLAAAAPAVTQCENWKECEIASEVSCGGFVIFPKATVGIRSDDVIFSSPHFEDVKTENERPSGSHSISRIQFTDWDAGHFPGVVHIEIADVGTGRSVGWLRKPLQRLSSSCTF